MSKEFGHLKPAVKKAINSGIIDSWLRGLCALVPEAKSNTPTSQETVTVAGMDVATLAINTFTLCYGYDDNHTLIDHPDIEKMDGYKQLIAISSQNNVRLDLTDMGSGNLIVDFTPEEPFSNSEILGKKFTNVLPGLFGLKRH